MPPVRQLATRLLVASLASLAASLAACGDDQPTDPTARPDAALAGAPASAQKELAAARAATARYQDVARATADGYQPVGECVAIPGAAMGVHYLSMPLLADPALDPERPEVLVYEPQKGGGMKLVAVEYMIPKAAWDAKNPGKRPTLFAGTAFEDGPMDTYALHAWVWRHNPAGIFAPFNAQANCPTPSGAGAHAGHH
jgi:hypothetical protein